MGSFDRSYPDAFFEGPRMSQAPGDTEYSGVMVAAGVALSFAASGLYLARVGMEHVGIAARRIGRDTKATVVAFKDSFSAGFLGATAQRVTAEAGVLPQASPEVSPTPPQQSVLSALGAEAWVQFAETTSLPSTSEQPIGPRSTRRPTEDFVV